MSATVCPIDPNDLSVDPGNLISPDGEITWKRHYIGWAVAGGCALVATLISFYLMYKHARNYNKPREQRHIVRIIFMIPIYAIISWLSYRWYHYGIYFEVVRDCYEAFVIYSFFVLLLTYLGEDTQQQLTKMNLHESRPMVFPLGCYQYHPHQPNFLHKIRYGILQYVVIKPIATIACVVLEVMGLYCANIYSIHFGKLYIMAINFVSVSVAMYCLVLFYVTIKEDIKEYSPLMKFMCVKLVIFFCFWQTTLLGILGSLGVFKPAPYWSKEAIELGINVLAICAEMVIFSILHVTSFSYKPYVIPGTSTYLRKALKDAFNPIDIGREIGWAFSDVWLLLRGKPMPIREDKLSGTFQRAEKVRASRLSQLLARDKAGRDMLGSPGSPSSPLDHRQQQHSIVQVQTNSSSHGDAIAAAHDPPSYANRPDARLLNHIDGRTYSQQEELQRQQNHVAIEMQEQQHRAQQQHQYQLQQQQQMASGGEWSTPTTYGSTSKSSSAQTLVAKPKPTTVAATPTLATATQVTPTPYLAESSIDNSSFDFNSNSATTTTDAITSTDFAVTGTGVGST